MKQILVVIVTALLVVVAPQAQSEEQENSGSVYTISVFTLKPGAVDEYLSARQQTQPMILQNEFIKSRKVFRHYWGPEWSVMVITEYASMADIERASARTRELYHTAYPDEEEFKRRNDLLHGLQIGHDDAIVKEVPGLGK
jgi:hypothetical protein